MKIYEICPDCGGDCVQTTHTPIDRDCQPEVHNSCKNCTDGTLWEVETFEVGKKYLDENHEFTHLENMSFTENHLVLEFTESVLEIPVTGTYRIKKTGEIELVVN